MDSRWEEKFTLLVQYNEREDYCNVPHKYIEDSKNLGTWLSISTQRRSNKEGTLDEERKRRQEDIGIVSMSTTSWERMCKLLIQYNERKGLCNVPLNHYEDDVHFEKYVE